MESTLALTKDDLEAEVGFFLGHGRGVHGAERVWTAKEQNAIDSCIKSGLRNFYFPPPMEGVIYEWTFLKPVATLTVPEGERDVPLPDDCGAGIESQITATVGGSTCFAAIPVTGEGRIRQLYAETPDMTGAPQLAAITPLKGTTATRGQRFQLSLYPEADADYELTFAYHVVPGALDGTRPYHYGGAAHAETILESCLAVAESRLDDTAGTHKAMFMERLNASIMLDRKSKPGNLGYNGDRASERELISRRQNGLVFSFDGVTYP